MVEQNITLFEHYYYFDNLKATLEALNIPEWTHIAENMVSVDSVQYYQFMADYIHEAGTMAYSRGYLTNRVLQVAPMEKWWKSTEKIPGRTPYGSVLTNRRWLLNEVRSYRTAAITNIEYIPGVQPSALVSSTGKLFQYIPKYLPILI